MCCLTTIMLVFGSQITIWSGGCQTKNSSACLGNIVNVEIGQR